MAFPLLRGLASLAVVTFAFNSSGGLSGAPASPGSGPSPSSAASGVTIYGARWCGACKGLEAKLAQRSVPFDVIDVDQNPSAFERARSQAGAGSSIPLTNVSRGSNVTWVVGDDADAVERAYKGP